MATYMAGMKELYDRLQKLSTVDQRKIVRRRLREAAQFMMVQERTASPIVTGTLVSQYRVKAIKRTRRGIGYHVRLIPKVGQRWYASFVNYGWTGRPVGPRFIDKAVEANAKDALEIVVEGMKEELNALGH